MVMGRSFSRTEAMPDKFGVVGIAVFVVLQPFRKR